MSNSDSWRTPQWLFDELNKEFNFDIDLCATAENSKCDVFMSDYLTSQLTSKYYCNEIEDKIITEDWTEYLSRGKIQNAFMNPPYSNPKPFIEKAWEDSKHCKIVLLVKVDPSTKWWATFWDYGSGYICGKCNSISTCPTRRNCECDHLTTFKDAGPKLGCEVRFLSKRVKFDPPKGFMGKASSPSFPSAIIVMDRRGL